MVTPELPTGVPIGHAIFHHEPDRQGHDPVGVMAARRSDIRHVGTEILVTGLAVVLRVGEVQLAGSPRHQVADIAQPSCEHMLPRSRLAALRARALSFKARLFGDLVLGQVFNAGESHIRQIFESCLTRYGCKVETAGKTMVIYLPLTDLMDFSFALSKSASDKINDVIFSAARVALSTDADFDFYCSPCI